MFKHISTGQLGFFLVVSVLTSACTGGQIGDAPGAGLDPGFDDVALKCPGASPDVSASNGWQSKRASQSAPDTLYFEVMARPTEASADALVAVGAQNIDDLSDVALAVRFSDRGVIDVLDGSEYNSDGLFEYDPGVWYNIAISADVAARTYNVEVGRCGEKRSTIARRASFGTRGKFYEWLSTWAVWSSRFASLELSTPTWMPSGTCAPATCQSLGSNCGEPSDGCNGTLNCGVCGGGQLCTSGVCVDEPVAVPPPSSCTSATCQSVGSNCGQLDDGCDGSLNCGACGSGENSSNNVCVDEPVVIPPPPTCTPATCQSLGSECGQLNDGCNGTLNCGACGSGEICSNDVCVDALPPACQPDTCQSLGNQCGVVGNGCGGYLSCGSCSSGEMCSSGICVDEPPPACQPTTCQSSGTECGTASDGCGGSLSCGGCGSGEMCSSGVCINEPAPPPGGDPDRPWAHNTGASNPAALVPSGPVTLSSPGVYENLDINGDIYITSSNVTVRNFRVNAAGNQRGIWIVPGLSNIVLEDGEVFGMSSIGIYGIGYTARRLHIHDSGGDALRPEGNPGAGATLVEYCFIERMGLSANAHADALQVSNVSEGSYNVTLQYNNFYMPAPGTPGHPGDTSKASAVIFLEKPVTNYLIQNNWLDGGGYTVYCGNNTGGVVWRNNVFGRDYDYGAVTGTCQNWSGNVWEDTGAPVPPN